MSEQEFTVSVSWSDWEESRILSFGGFLLENPDEPDALHVLDLEVGHSMTFDHEGLYDGGSMTVTRIS